MNHRTLIRTVVLGVCLLAAATTHAQRQSVTVPADFKKVETRYYVIHTDLEGDVLKEANLRVTAMAEEYYDRTKGFSGKIRRRLPFFLFKQPMDYYRAGGMPGSVGVFMGNRLMAVTGERVGKETWATIQHEGFHQFAHYVIRGDLPIWVNEGLAEYFGESIFTGDNFVSGIMPPARILRVQRGIRAKRYRSVKDLMQMSHLQWNMGLSIHNYDQAWSMAHFLIHADNGKYRGEFGKFMTLIGKKVRWETAWKRSFGDVDGFHERWSKWWLKQKPSASEDAYQRAATSVAASFLARAESQKQSFENFEKFSEAALKGDIKHHEDQWLPTSLFKAASRTMRNLESELTTHNNRPAIKTVRKDGVVCVGSFIIRGNKVDKVTAKLDRGKLVLDEANELAEAGKKTEARQLIVDELRSNPRGIFVEELRKLVRTLH